MPGRIAAGAHRLRRPGGHWPLRAAIAAHLRHARGIRTRPEEIIVVAGSQEGLNLAGRLLDVAKPRWRSRTLAIKAPISR